MCVWFPFDFLLAQIAQNIHNQTHQNPKFRVQIWKQNHNYTENILGQHRTPKPISPIIAKKHKGSAALIWSDWRDRDLEKKRKKKKRALGQVIKKTVLTTIHLIPKIQNPKSKLKQTEKKRDWGTYTEDLERRGNLMHKDPKQ